MSNNNGRDKYNKNIDVIVYLQDCTQKVIRIAKKAQNITAAFVLFCL